MSIIVISGPSGVGKNTVVAEVLKAIPELRLGSSLTTRARRPNDVPGKYTYVSRREFDARAKRGALLEWAQYNGDLYGTLRPEGRGPWLLEIEVQGASQIKRLDSTALLIFMVTPGASMKEQLAVLAERLRRRGTDEPSRVQQRLIRADAEFRQGQSQSDVVVVNDDLETAVQQTVTCIRTFLAKK